MDADAWEAETVVTAKDGNDEEEEEVEDEDELAATKEDFWDTEEAQKLQEDATSEKGLTILFEGSQRRVRANKTLEKTLEESRFGMDALLQEQIVQSLVQPLLQEFASMFEKLETQLKKAFQDNTQRRWDMQQRLVKYEEQWQRQYQELTARIHEIDDDELKEEDGRKDGLGDNVEKNTHSDGTADQSPQQMTNVDASPSKDSQGSDSEPDWYALKNQDHAPTVARIHSFLEAGERLEAAEDQFKRSFDEIYHKLEATTEDLVQIAVEVHSHLDGAMESEEMELQYYLVENSQRRQALAQAVDESAKQAQGTFARLMARVKTLTGGGKRKRDAVNSA